MERDTGRKVLQSFSAFFLLSAYLLYCVISE